jgi:3-oxoacyl-[acyl-carrier protein] reductase
VVVIIVADRLKFAQQKTISRDSFRRCILRHLRLSLLNTARKTKLDCMPNALILGASGTFGSAIATELLERGFNVGLHYNMRKEPCDALVESHPDSALFQADLSDPAQPAILSAAFLKKFERVDALVWACGISLDAPLVSQPEADVRAVLNVDLKAFFFMLKAFSRQFIKQKSGSVLALSSHAALAGRSGGSAYAMAQSGLIALVKSSAREWGGIGVRVNAVVPPFVAESTMGRAASPEFIAAAKLKRVLKPEVDGSKALGKFAIDVLLNPCISGQVLHADSRIV